MLKKKGQRTANWGVKPDSKRKWMKGRAENDYHGLSSIAHSGQNTKKHLLTRQDKESSSYVQYKGGEEIKRNLY